MPLCNLTQLNKTRSVRVTRVTRVTRAYRAYRMYRASRLTRLHQCPCPPLPLPGPASSPTASPLRFQPPRRAAQSRRLAQASSPVRNHSTDGSMAVQQLGCPGFYY